MRRADWVHAEDAEHRLAQLIYQVCHGRQQIPERATRALPADALMDREFAAGLSRANGGIGPRHDSWTVRTIEDDGRLAVELDGLMLWIDGQAGASVGDRVAVRLPKEYRNLYPGHYVAIGDADRGTRANPVRIYWNIGSEGAPVLLEAVTRTFNARNIAFRFKLLSSPRAYTRADAAILYLPAFHRAEGAELVRQVYRDVRSIMRTPNSAFVLALAPGLGLAEDPMDGSSFGLHRSRLIASMLIAAVHHEEPLSEIASGLEGAGYDLRHFYRNPGSSARYDDFVVDDV